MSLRHPSRPGDGWCEASPDKPPKTCGWCGDPLVRFDAYLICPHCDVPCPSRSSRCPKCVRFTVA